MGDNEISNNHEQTNANNLRSEKLFNLKYPSHDKIASRTSTVARAMASTLAPIVGATSSDQSKMKEALFIDDTVRCVYCGCEGTTNNKLQLDHLFPLVGEKGPSGYFTEPYNLVPCCSACNGSKGSKKWNEYMDITNYILKDKQAQNLLCGYLKNELNRYIKNRDSGSCASNLCGYWTNIASDDNNKRKKIYKLLNKMQPLSDSDKIEILLYTIKDGSSPIDWTKLRDDVKDYTKNFRCNNSELVEYLNDCKNKDHDDTQRKIIHRLLMNDDKNNTYSDRYERLTNYCNAFFGNESLDKHQLFNTNEIKNWFNELYSSIQMSLETAQIQIEAFNAGVRSKINNGNQSFEEYFKEQVSDKGQSGRILRAIGFTDNGIIRSALTKKEKKYAEQIKDDAGKAFASGSKYVEDNNQKELLKLLYDEKKVNEK